MACKPRVLCCTICAGPADWLAFQKDLVTTKIQLEGTAPVADPFWDAKAGPQRMWYRRLHQPENAAWFSDFNRLFQTSVPDTDRVGQIQAIAEKLRQDVYWQSYVNAKRYPRHGEWASMTVAMTKFQLDNAIDQWEAKAIKSKSFFEEFRVEFGAWYALQRYLAEKRENGPHPMQGQLPNVRPFGVWIVWSYGITPEDQALEKLLLTMLKTKQGSIHAAAITETSYLSQLLREICPPLPRGSGNRVSWDDQRSQGIPDPEMEPSGLAPKPRHVYGKMAKDKARQGPNDAQGEVLVGEDNYAPSERSRHSWHYGNEWEDDQAQQAQQYRDDDYEELPAWPTDPQASSSASVHGADTRSQRSSGSRHSAMQEDRDERASVRSTHSHFSAPRDALDELMED